MSGVCARHMQYVPPGERCPYCVPGEKAAPTVAATAAVQCESGDGQSQCRAPSAWLWVLVSENPIETRLHVCSACHSRRMEYEPARYADWTKTPIGDAAP